MSVWKKRVEAGDEGISRVVRRGGSRLSVEEWGSRAALAASDKVLREAGTLEWRCDDGISEDRCRLSDPENRAFCGYVLRIPLDALAPEGSE